MKLFRCRFPAGQIPGFRPGQKLLLLGAVLLGLARSQAQQAFPFYEPFPAADTNSGAAVTLPNGTTSPGQPLGGTTSATVWSIGGGTGGGSPQIVGGPVALNYPGLATNSSATAGLYIPTNTTTGNRTRGILLTPTSSGKLYFSFLLNVQAAPANNRLFAMLTTATTGTPTGSSGVGIWVNSTTNLLISKSSSSTPSATNNTPLTPGTHLVVARYTWNPSSGDDAFDLWVDPGSLGGAEASVPAVSATTTTGNDLATINSFYVYQPSSGYVPAGLFVDEIRVGTAWADVTPTTAACNPASISANPGNQTVTQDLPATFTVVAGGSSPAYQWQVSPNSGGSWTSLLNATNASYSTPNLAVTDSGKQYRCAISVACDSTATNSAAATVTVNPAAVTPVGLVVDDFWADGSRTNAPVTTNSAIWDASTAASLTDPDNGAPASTMVGTPGNNTSVLWIGYFTPVTNLPVHLAVGTTLQATLTFTPINVASQTNAGIRIGLFDYADGGIRVTNDGFGTGSTGDGLNVTGYGLDQNFCTTFNANTPMNLYVRNNLSDNNLIGTLGDYALLGSGPVGATLLGQPGFQSGTNYTVVLSVARTGTNSCTVTTSITGGGTNWTTSAVDTNYAYHRFDAIGIRPNNQQTTAGQFNFTEFKVEVISNAVTSIPLGIQLAGTNIILSWSNPAFSLLAAPQVTGTYTTVAGAVSPYTNTVGTTQQFFRLKSN